MSTNNLQIMYNQWLITLNYLQKNQLLYMFSIHDSFISHILVPKALHSTLDRYGSH